MHIYLVVVLTAERLLQNLFVWSREIKKKELIPNFNLVTFCSVKSTSHGGDNGARLDHLRPDTKKIPESIKQ